MTVKALKKKNNMKPFKLRAGNKPSIAKLAGISPVKNRETVDGKLVKHKHKDGSIHSYAETKKDNMGGTVKGGTDETGTITPASMKKGPMRFESKVAKMKAEFDKLEAMENRTPAQEKKYIALGKKLDAAYGDDTRG